MTDQKTYHPLQMVVSDGTGGTTKIVDVSGLATNNGKSCTKVRLNKVSY